MSAQFAAGQASRKRQCAVRGTVIVTRGSVLLSTRSECETPCVVAAPTPDVGPFSRQVLARNGAVDDRVMLPLLDELVRRQMTERAVRPALIVIEPPSFDLHPGVVHGHELVHVQTLVAKPPVERLNKRRFPSVSRAW